jgi:SAM-dependent methyltransferase
MQRNSELDSIIKGFTDLYWLKPVDIVWDAVNAYLIKQSIKDDQVLLDLGCGDGLYAALMFGGELPIDYDRFVSVIPENQAIGENQEGDIYSKPKPITRLQKMPSRRIDYGLELKNHHLEIARSLDIYDNLIEGRMEEFEMEDDLVDLVYSIFAFYWGDDLDAQIKEVHRVLKDDGEFIVNLPTEHLYDMHLCKKMVDDPNISEELRTFYDTMDGGRRHLTSRYGKSKDEWKDFFSDNSFEVTEIIPIVNEVMFTLQDISQRPFLPSAFKITNSPEIADKRDNFKRLFSETFCQDVIDICLPHECEEQVRHGYYLIKAKKV